MIANVYPVNGKIASAFNVVGMDHLRGLAQKIISHLIVVICPVIKDVRPIIFGEFNIFAEPFL